MRLYTVSQVHKNVQVEFNTESFSSAIDDPESIIILDAVAKLQFDGFELWLGRQLPPSDRSNLDGPFYLNAAYQFPIVQSFGYLGALAVADEMMGLRSMGMSTVASSSGPTVFLRESGVARIKTIM